MMTRDDFNQLADLALAAFRTTRDEVKAVPSSEASKDDAEAKRDFWRKLYAMQEEIK